LNYRINQNQKAKIMIFEEIMAIIDGQNQYVAFCYGLVNAPRCYLCEARRENYF